MKKIAVFFLILVVGVSSVFADNDSMTSFKGAIKGQSTSSDLKFKLDPEEVSFYRFGFTSDGPTISRPNAEDEPTPLTEIRLELTERKDAAVSTGSNNIYYYISAAEKPKLTLTAGKGLHRDTYDGVITYDVILGGGYDGTAKSGGVGLEIPLKKVGPYVYANTIPFSIKTTTDITVGMASSKEEWSDTITLTISKN